MRRRGSDSTSAWESWHWVRNLTVLHPMDSETGRKPLHFTAALACSFALVTGSFVIEQTIRWTNHLKGFVSGLYHVVFIGIVWAVYFLPWSLLVFGLFRWRKWKRFRTAWLIGPAFLWFAVGVSDLITSPPMPQHRFKQFAKVSLPVVLEDLRYDFQGGGLADYSDTYYFRCAAEDVDRLIVEMRLEKVDSAEVLERSLPVKALPKAPDPLNWKGASLYYREDNSWFYYLLVNEERTAVYIRYSCL
jgi:hypothetical protein